MFKILHNFLNRKKIIHFCVHKLGNAGDNVLFNETRSLFDLFIGKSSWIKKPVRHYCSPEMISLINKNNDAIIVGGGGLLLKDTAANNNSGWQWNCPIESLEKIDIPLIIFAIGYNRFYGQDDFDEIFKTHIIKTINKASFFGLRNFGSITSLKEYLPNDLHSKLMMQPCPTTLLSYMYPQKANKANRTKYLAVNLAFDRLEKRYGKNIEQILDSISRAILILQKMGWRIDYVKHSKNDEYALSYLNKNNINYNYVNLDKKSPKKVINYYRKVPITIGMRGHSQMIPYGLQNNIISLISHPKLLYFLKDIGCTDWAIDINSKELCDEIVCKVNDIGFENETAMRFETIAN